jgi:Asp-tRNA(Asn)/Glu-tRNA(Gln) amidotransferase B subunit
LFTEQHGKEIDEMLAAHNEWTEKGLEPADQVLAVAFNKKLLIFQNPSIPKLIEEVMANPLYAEYKAGKEKLKGALLGALMKKYPGCDIKTVEEQL